MALYLGNQKVSLRSGQDPTFDYGFDSNGRLVFANKNATEINNFLNYDSSYSEILDLSNLSKMEKVAVNGTADRKMEGLKGLLVSPNAPFTGSSPQINASYTGLSKSALVSLFESAPYNVGYTKVGSPTIVDGVASGFSRSSFLTLPSLSASSMEFVFKVNAEGVSKSQNIILRPDNTNFVLRITNSYVYLLFNYFNNGVSTIAYLVTADGSVDLNNYVWIKGIIKNGLQAIYLSTEGTNYTLGASSNYESVDISSNQIVIGSRRDDNNNFSGSIDLNETYIKVNGVPWFTGKPAMTKTCSIVGATGAADLTQEDKNIILNKGWSLTVQ